MNILYILLAVLILGVIVMAHEFGHFIVGRLCGIAVEEFSIGMGPKILSRQGKKTLYSIRLLPLGGFCRFRGEDEDDDDPAAMNNQPVWKRFLTVIAGAGMNFVFAFIVCAVMLANYMIAEYQPRISALYEGTPAVESGLEIGDVVTSINGVELSYDGVGTALLQETVRTSDLSQPLELVVNRNGEALRVSVIPAPAYDEATGETVYQIGIGLGGRTFTFAEAIGESAGYMWDFTKEMLKALKNLFFHGEGLEDTMGPVGIISYVSEYVREGMYMALYLIFFISLNLGIMNLLPLPALDGGRLIFLIVEGIRRKPIPRDKEGMVHAAGFILLIGLILFFTYKDILRIVTG